MTDFSRTLVISDGDLAGILACSAASAKLLCPEGLAQPLATSQAERSSLPMAHSAVINSRSGVGGTTHCTARARSHARNAVRARAPQGSAEPPKPWRERVQDLRTAYGNIPAAFQLVWGADKRSTIVSASRIGSMGINQASMSFCRDATSRFNQ